MSRYLLDTNILSDAVKPAPCESLGSWLAAQRDSDLFVSTLSLAEVCRGILQRPAGRKREALRAWYEGAEGPPRLFRGRILPFDHAAADAWARLMADGARRGSPRSPLDMIVAATAEAHACIVVSANERHFAGVVPLLNPMRSNANP